MCVVLSDGHLCRKPGTESRFSLDHINGIRSAYASPSSRLEIFALPFVSATLFTLI